MNYLKSLISGRLGRKNFFWASILRLALFFLFVGASVGFGGSDEIIWQKIIAWFVLAILWYFGFSVHLRRFYDMGANKTLSMILSILMGFPFAVFGLLFIFLIFKKGTTGQNKYGDPSSSKFIDAVFKLKTS